jgi:hypothetical protein
MIRRAQLAEALQRLDPRDRELLSLSLRRRVPDEALARMYASGQAEVARRRAAAIDRLADELEIQRGDELGSVLTALLEPETWSGMEAAPGQEFTQSTPGFATQRGGRAEEAEIEDGPGEPGAGPVPPDPEPAVASEPPVTPEPAPAENPEPVADGDPVAARVEAPAKGPAWIVQVAGEPVLEMLVEREGGEGERSGSHARTSVAAVAGLGLAALLAGAGLVGAGQFGDDGPGQQRGGAVDGTRTFVPAKRGPLAAPFVSGPPTTSCYSTAYVRRSTVLYRQPGGQARLRITARTEWSSPRVMGVVGQRGDWLGVQVPELGNGEVGWIPRDRAQVDCVRWSLHVDLSKRRLVVRKDGRPVAKMTIAIGSPRHPTPLGRFSVTDKLRVTDPDSPYGCCVLALSGHQTRLPPDWPGGDRLAVHATTELSTIGQPVSLGCMRTDSRRARWLIETIPLGAPIFVRS